MRLSMDGCVVRGANLSCCEHGFGNRGAARVPHERVAAASRCYIETCRVAATRPCFFSRSVAFFT